jgi:uncharacterized protein YerC
MSEFRVIKEFPDYEINREGIVRRISDGFNPKAWQPKNKNQSPIYHINKKPRSLSRLIRDAFTELPFLKNLDFIGFRNYGISEDGKIWSYKRKIFLKPKIDKDGYFEVCLRKNNKGKYFRVHRLVGFAYILNIENKPMINHKDGNKQNNNYSNLEWVNNSENVRHAIENKLQKTIRQNEITDPIKIHDVCRLLEKGDLTLVEIEKITGVSAKIISGIRVKKHWSFISDQYSFDTKPKFKKLTEKELHKIFNLISENHTLEFIANRFDCGTSTIHRIRSRETYKHISKNYDW